MSLPRLLVALEIELIDFGPKRRVKAIVYKGSSPKDLTPDLCWETWAVLESQLWHWGRYVQIPRWFCDSIYTTKLGLHVI